MKKLYILTVMGLLLIKPAFAQIFFEDAEGDEIFITPDELTNNRILGKVNTSAQTLEFRSFISLPNPDGIIPQKYITVAVKGKPSDGIATLFNNGNFNTSTSASLGYIMVKPFSSKNIEANDKTTDYFVANLVFEKNRYTLFNPNIDLESQISSLNFAALRLEGNYNLLIGGQHLLSATAGYGRSNNYNDLKVVEIQDTQLVAGAANGATRTSTTTINARQGMYEEFDIFPARLAYTFCPSEADEDQLKLGFTAFASRNFGNVSSFTKLGSIIFLAKVDPDTGVRVPTIGLIIQSDDFFDEANSNNSLTKRVSVGLTTTFTISQY